MEPIFPTGAASIGQIPYTPGIIANGFLFCSGQIGMDETTHALPDGIEAQTRQTMERIKVLVNHVGLTMADIVDVQVWLTSMDDYGVMNEVYGSYFDNAPPTRACFAVSGLPLGALVEIKITALMREEKL